MSWHTLPDHIQELAADLLTPKQLAAFQLELDGWSQWAIAYHLGISRRAVRDRLETATLKLIAAGLRQDHDGNWHTETAA